MSRFYRDDTTLEKRGGINMKYTGKREKLK